MYDTVLELGAALLVGDVGVDLEPGGLEAGLVVYPLAEVVYLLHVVVEAALGGRRLDGLLVLDIVQKLFLELCVFEVVYHRGDFLLAVVTHSVCGNEFVDDVALHLFVVVGVRTVGVGVEPRCLEAVVVVFVGALLVQLSPVVIRIGQPFLPIDFASQLFLELRVFD